MHKINAGDGYLYLTQNIAHGDIAAAPDAAGYYTARGNPPGYWLGHGLTALDLAPGGRVSEVQMKALYGQGQHPDAENITAAYMAQNARPDLTPAQLAKVQAEAERAARLGRPFPKFRAAGVSFERRVGARLATIAKEAGREPTAAEIGNVRAEESRRATKAVAGFDLVFTPPKSASLLWALHPNAQVRAEIKYAHDAAIAEAMKLLEAHAAHTRTGKGGVAQIDTAGLVAAVFDHFDSRDGDPNLHSHVVVSNKVQGADGVWRALDARSLHRITVAVSQAYDTAFRAETTRRLGVGWSIRPDTAGHREPVAEITGVKPEWIKAHSRRRTAIETKAEELTDKYRCTHGKNPDVKARKALMREANLATRKPKGEARSLRELIAAWRDDFTTRFGGTAVDQLAMAVPAAAPRAAGTDPATVDINAVAGRVLAEVSERFSTWTRFTIEAETHRSLKREGVNITDPDKRHQVAEAITAEALRASIDLTPPALADEPAALRRASGESVFTQHGANRFTSTVILDAEAALVTAATINATAATTPVSVADTAVASFEQAAGRALDDGQKAMVTAFACDTRQLVAGIGPAGSGKTTAMKALASVLDSDGRRVIPLATSGASAAILTAELGTPAENVHKFLTEHTRGPFAQSLRDGNRVPRSHALYQVRAGDVILIDEAGMAGTLNLARVLSIAEHHGASVRLLGDHRQLSAVESGGALRLIASETGAVELSTLHRFTDPHEAAATLALRVGDSRGLDFYQHADRIHAADTDTALSDAYAGWRSDMLDGKTSVMIAASNTDVAWLSAQARADRVAAGRVEAAGVELHDGNQAGAGDWITTRAPDRRLTATNGEFVRNGDTWHVTNRHRDGSLTARHLDHGGHLRLPGWYVAQHVELVYAATVHRSQGSTVDTTHAIITEAMTREHLYVAATRARQRTDLYVITGTVTEDSDSDAKLHRQPAAEARAVLEAVVASKGAQLSVTEMIRQTQDEAASLAALVPECEYAAQQYAAPRGENAATMAVHRAMPWVTIPAPAIDAQLSLMDEFVEQKRDDIAARVDYLTDEAIRARPAWMSHLGATPDDPTARQQWRAKVATVAAWRDHQQITTPEAAGPWITKNQPGRNGFETATRAAVEARAIAEALNPTPGGAKPSQIDFRAAMRAAERDHTGHHRAPQPKHQPAQRHTVTETTGRPSTAPRVPSPQPETRPQPIQPPPQPPVDLTQQPQPRW